MNGIISQYSQWHWGSIILGTCFNLVSFILPTEFTIQPGLWGVQNLCG